ncbi:MAG: hypothetical protein GEU83_14515 [Pseudonocardiaceae bacterium]|nr:hypothetical protein [Pseudonocardiaceae bacterium]
MAELPLTEGDLDRGHPPNLDRLQAIAALAPHLPPTEPLWEQVVQWATRHLDQDAPALFIEQRHQAAQLRDHGRLPDSHTLTSWALTHARREAHQRRT